MKFFSWDPTDGGFEFHDTAKEAKAEAQSAFDYCKDEAGDGWPEETGYICWGRVTECVTLISKRPADEVDDPPNLDEIWEYDWREPE